jgi:hypothetical protein
VLEDRDAFAELAMLGIRSVPIVRRGRDWANGQVLREVARVAGIAWAREWQSQRVFSGRRLDELIEKGCNHYRQTVAVCRPELAEIVQ